MGPGEVDRHVTAPLEHKEDKQEEEQPENLVSVSLVKGDLLNEEKQSLTGIGGLGQGSPKVSYSGTLQVSAIELLAGEFLLVNSVLVFLLVSTSLTFADGFFC